MSTATDYATNTLGTFSSGLDSFLGRLRGARTTFNQGQQDATGSFLGSFKDALLGQESLPSMYKKYGNEQNLPQLQENAQNLQNTFANIPYTYSSASKGYDVNQNQLDRIVGTKSAEMAPAVQSATTAAQNAENIVATKIGLQQAEQERQLTPYQYEADFLKDRLARESAGFSEDNQTELTSLLQKMQAGITLTEGEQQRINQLAVAEKQYQTEMAKIASNEKIANNTNDTNRLNALINYRKLTLGQT